jgi:hypothetical protein
MKAPMKTTLLALILTFVNSIAIAQTAEAGPAKSNVMKGAQQKKQSLNFEDELVEGQTSKPELFYLFQKKNFNYKRLIRLRENFVPEMRKTSEDLQRVRSRN